MCILRQCSRCRLKIFQVEMCKGKFIRCLSSGIGGAFSVEIKKNLSSNPGPAIRLANSSPPYILLTSPLEDTGRNEFFLFVQFSRKPLLIAKHRSVSRHIRELAFTSM